MVKTDGSPFGNPARVTEWLKNDTGGVIESASEELRCCFCWKGQAVTLSGHHAAKDCPFLKSWNKMRAQRSLTPIVVQEGRVIITAAKQPLTVEKLAGEYNKGIKEVRGQIGKLDQRVTTIESKGKKRTQSDASSTHPSSTRPKKQKTKGQTATIVEVQVPPAARPSGQGKGGKGKKGKGKPSGSASQAPTSS